MKPYIYLLVIAVLNFNLTYGQCNIKNCPSCSKNQDKTTQTTNIYRGQILDAITNEPAMFANIVLTNEVYTFGASTDIDGLFNFSGIPNGNYQVTVKLIGYKTYTKNLTLLNGIVTDKINISEEAYCLCSCPIIIEPIPEDLTTDAVLADAIPVNGRDLPTAGYEGHNFIEDPAIIFPNPARDNFNIKSTDPITVIEILNITGEVVVDKLLPVNNQVDISNLAAGQYFVRIFFENKREVQIERMIVTK